MFIVYIFECLTSAECPETTTEFLYRIAGANTRHRLKGVMMGDSSLGVGALGLRPSFQSNAGFCTTESVGSCDSKYSSSYHIPM